MDRPPSRPGHRADDTRPEHAEHTLRWVLAHEPPVIFEDAAQAFVDLVRERSDGDIDVVLYGADDFLALTGAEHLSRAELVRGLQRGDVEMAHCYVSALGAWHQDLWALELPYLFDDYDHAERVLDGPVGTQLLEGLLPQGLRGLAFAYSGGFRVVPTAGRALRSPADFAGLTLRTSGNPVPEALYSSLGATAIGADLAAIPELAAAGRIDGCELTWVRYLAAGLDEHFDTINETHHSLFTTMTSVNEQWFQGLSDKHQATIHDAAREACRLERQVSIREEAATRKACEQLGLQVVDMAPEQAAELRTQGLKVRDQLTPRFGAELIDAVRAQA